tara:strand:+ start:944 stop:1192 length:249 start_codon:yes stop_codon:yes gene_type:complete
MPLKHFTHDFNPRPPDPYAKERLFKAAKELGYVVLPTKDWSTLHELVSDRLTLIEERPDDERDYCEEDILNEVLLGLNELNQ